jgi:hypothetical protein
MKVLAVLSLLVAADAFAWGPTGHRVVGLVAEKNLRPGVLQKVSRILGGHSLSRASNWSDEIKSEPATYGHTFNWHYTDWKDQDPNHDETNSSGRLLSAIKEQLAVLKDAKATTEKKAFALKFLVHLVGDLHQPLHVGNGLDRGGNNCKVQFHGQPTNLHALWDEGLIDFTKLSFTELADYVSKGRAKEEVAAWKKGDLVAWARESKELRAEIYPPDVTPAKTPGERKYCPASGTVAADDVPKLAYEYSYKFAPVLERRLYQAGLRLAVILNETVK